MRPEDGQLKVSLSKKRKARATKTMPKKAKTIGAGPKDAPVEQTPEVVAEVILATSIQPPLPTSDALPPSTPVLALNQHLQTFPAGQLLGGLG